MQTWQWGVLGALVYLVVAVAMSGVNWAMMFGRTRVPPHARSFRARWRLYGMPLSVILLYPPAYLALALIEPLFVLFRRMRPGDIEGRKVPKRFRDTSMSLSGAMYPPSAAAPPHSPAPVTLPAGVNLPRAVPRRSEGVMR